MKIMIRLIFILSVFKVTEANFVDYWSDEFDTTRSCSEKKTVEKLLQMDPSQCVDTTVSDSEEIAFRICRLRLSEILMKACHYSKVENAGSLLYCKARGVITCCFKDQVCNTWSSIQNSIYTTAKEYLTNKKDVLSSLIISSGYKTCHHLESLDATVCAKDCKKLEESDFASSCKSKGGLFKCCVRRDKQNCHECRFCCTLPMCTYPPGGKDSTEFIELKKTELKTQKNNLTAKDLFFSRKHIYKNDDYYCLKPFSHKDPKKWRRYNMEEFRRASNLNQLDKVKTYKYDNNLYNFVDPKVFKAFTSSNRKSRKVWKRTYGFQYTSMIPGFHHFETNKTVDATNCLKKCAKLEKSKFAKECKKDNGILKCCITYWTLGVFEDARNALISDGLVKDSVTKFCKPKGKKDPCQHCSMNGFCTKFDPFTGKIRQIHALKEKISKKGNLV